MDTALRKVRLVLLEADVDFKGVKDFLTRVRERAIGEEVVCLLLPAQMVIKIVNEELIKTLGEPAKIDLSGDPPHVAMLVGLQGSGKAMTAAKLALVSAKAVARRRRHAAERPHATPPRTTHLLSLAC